MRDDLISIGGKTCPPPAPPPPSFSPRKFFANSSNKRKRSESNSSSNSNTNSSLSSYTSQLERLKSSLVSLEILSSREGWPNCGKKMAEEQVNAIFEFLASPFCLDHTSSLLFCCIEGSNGATTTTTTTTNNNNNNKMGIKSIQFSEIMKMNFARQHEWLRLGDYSFLIKKVRLLLCF